MIRPHVKYEHALTIIAREGFRLAMAHPPGFVLYHFMAVLGYRWCAQTGEWVKCRRSMIELDKETTR